ncbi:MULTISPECIES: hypothetical protein [unclassified Coleofasciculus]|uniref:hypothetical protein n=1 Tax=unclassified Coleofasciculus TaxID=2692782 RepID=UPI001881E1F8|nr:MULTISPECIES: hypothetical protein [unclassified Coleofasciculus]MBE9129840.1 hypothetical protein [Coleofasciculus sp. LEGE 07081]MBE9152289.1 hypothetical protein [Coleofasciculus sp. LEGE 07092]
MGTLFTPRCTSLNDIIRLCSKIAPLADPLRSLTDVPRIETPLWRSQATAQPQILGNLVIVDTPGPNEAGENLSLAAVVEEQLQKSSLVLIVLDYSGFRLDVIHPNKSRTWLSHGYCTTPC